MRLFGENAVISVRFVHFGGETGDIDSRGGHVEIASPLAEIDFKRAEIAVLAGEFDVEIGKSGVGEQLIRQVNEALEARELIKLTVLETSPMKARECADEVAKATESDVVQVIGSKFILYKQSKDNKQIVLVK